MVVPDCLPDRDSAGRPKVVIAENADTNLPGVPQASFFSGFQRLCVKCDRMLNACRCTY